MGDLVKGFTEKRQKQLGQEQPKTLTISRRMFESFIKPMSPYILLKDEGYSFWWECPACELKFESDLSGMNCINVITEGTGPTERGRTAHWEPACPKCFKF